MNISKKIPPWLPKAAFIAGIVLFAAVIFHPLLMPGRCLFTTDDNFGMIPSLKNVMPESFFGGWSEAPFVGSGWRMPIMWTPIFLWLTPERIGFNWIHAVDLMLASIALAMFLRAAGLRWPAIALGLIAAFWTGNNLTLTYAGHLGKFGLLLFVAACLFGIRKTFESDRPWLWSIITGGSLGLMLMEQQDVGLFFGLFLGAYALFRIAFLSPNRARIAGFLRLFPMALLALTICGSNLIMIYTMNVNKTETAEQDNPRQKWEFATQWSWPPDESIDFIAPGYMGWRSSEGDGPYWGRMGRSPGWEKTGQGFMNFKLENQYLGVIPLIFALFAGLVAFTGGGKIFIAGRARVPRAETDGNMPSLPFGNMFTAPSARSEIIFWSCAAILALLLSFGKYFPLYALFYQLPFVGEIRNPNKFLHIFQLAAGILTAYGANYVFNWRAEKQ